MIFTPHLVPMDRGIFATIYAEPKGHAAVEHDLLELYRTFYARSPFIRVVEHLPATKDSAFTNYLRHHRSRRSRADRRALACLDNLIKGAAGVAVQNLNLMLGCAEETGFFRNRGLRSRLICGMGLASARRPGVNRRRRASRSGGRMPAGRRIPCGPPRGLPDEDSTGRAIS